MVTEMTVQAAVYANNSLLVNDPISRICASDVAVRSIKSVLVRCLSSSLLVIAGN